MKAERKRAIAIGLLFLVATIAYYAADVLILGVLDGSGGPVDGTVAANTLRTGALLLFLEGLAAVAIAVLIFPVLKRDSETLALGYFGLRLVETAGILLLMAPPLLIATGPGVAPGGMHWLAMTPIVYLCTAAAGSILACALCRARLVPRPIATLGVVGYPLLMLGTVLELFGVLELRQGAGLLLAWPVGLFELAFPIWLVARGFGPGRPFICPGAGPR